MSLKMSLTAAGTLSHLCKGIRTIPREILTLKSLSIRDQPKKVYELPSCQYPTLVSLPCLIPSSGPILTPAFLTIAQFDPLPVTSVNLPTHNPVIPMHANRAIRQKELKMKKHKIIKRWKRDYFLIQRVLRRETEKQGQQFRTRCYEQMVSAMEFKAEDHVTKFLDRVRWVPSEKYTEGGKRIYPHWTEKTAIEELYQLPYSDYIDKKAGFASEEDLEEIARLKTKYYQQLEDLKNKKS